jgi:DNA-binding NarL/FixJ family response regulator
MSATDGENVRVLVVDDHPAFREGVRTLLSTAPDVEVLEPYASTAEEAIQLAESLVPDVVLMDLNLAGNRNGIDATRRITGAAPSVGVLVLTMFDDADSIFAAMRAGARGYLLKGAGREDLLRAIRALSRGEAIFSPEVATRLQSFFRGDGPVRAAAFTQLTTREQEVLELLADGWQNARIAQDLHLSHKTVRNHVSNIFTKLQVETRAAAIVRARQAGVGSGSDVRPSSA